jgi:hypothetical protein
MFPPLLTKLKEKRVLNIKYTNELEAQKEKKMLSPIDNMKMSILIYIKRKRKTLDWGIGVTYQGRIACSSGPGLTP